MNAALNTIESTLRVIFGDCTVSDDIEGGYVHIKVHDHHAALRPDSLTHDDKEEYGYLIGSFDARGKWHPYSPELWTYMPCVTAVVAELIAGRMVMNIMQSNRTSHTSTYTEAV